MNPASLVQRPVIIQAGNILQANGTNINANLTKFALNPPQNESTLNLLEKKITYLEEENICFFNTIEKLVDKNNYLDNIIKENSKIDDSNSNEKFNSLIREKNSLCLQLENLSNDYIKSIEKIKNYEKKTEAKNLEHIDLKIQIAKLTEKENWYREENKKLDLLLNNNNINRKKIELELISVEKNSEEIKKLKEVIEEKNYQINNNSTQESINNGKLLEYKLKIQAHENLLSILEEKLKECKKENERLSIERNSLSNTIEEVNLTNNSLRNKILNIECEFNVLSANYSESINEKCITLQQIDALNTKCEELKQNFISCGNDYVKICSLKDDLSNKCLILENKNQTLESKLDEMTEKSAREK